MSITVDFLGTGDKVLLNGEIALFISTIPFHPTQRRFLIL